MHHSIFHSSYEYILWNIWWNTVVEMTTVNRLDNSGAISTWYLSQRQLKILNSGTFSQFCLANDITVLGMSWNFWELLLQKHYVTSYASVKWVLHQLNGFWPWLGQQYLSCLNKQIFATLSSSATTSTIYLQFYLEEMCVKWG